MAVLLSLKGAVAEFVHHGDTVAMEGFTHLSLFVANVNTTVIGDYWVPSVRLSRAGGASDLGALRELNAHPARVHAGDG